MPVHAVKSRIENIVKGLESGIDFKEIVQYGFDRKNPQKYRISRKPLTVEKLNELFKLRLEGINYFDAGKFAHCLGGRLATRAEWNHAHKNHKISVYGYKEWILPAKKDRDVLPELIFIEKIGKRRQAIAMEQRPEQRSPAYALRIVKDG
ncbi:MAG: hypothetical protein GY862_32340 [Gammaproteobacteria bacterium]|nr:hypothetical protein [Gammaproteobacteria bacterium]